MKRFLLFLTFICMGMIYASFSQELVAAERDLYKVRINDRIDIKVIDHPELNTPARVSEDGTITFPYIGSVYIKDMSLTEIEKVITEKLSAGYVKYPVVSVSLGMSSLQKIFTYGEINKRGEIPYEENLTLEEAISLAGGVSPQGLFGKVIVRRNQENSGRYKDIVEVILNNGIIDNRSTAEIMLKPDDILVVAHSKTFLIQGEVTQRGRFMLEKNMTVGRALLQAGGVSREGLYSKVKVRRKQEGEVGSYEDFAESDLNEGVIENKDVEDMLVQPDDILTVERNNTFLIQGEVLNRGRTVLEKDMTVLRALLQAGGVSKEGLYGTIKVRRKQEGEVGSYRDIAESDLNAGVIENKDVENTLLQSDDILIVAQNKTYFIYGEVNHTGEFVLKNDTTVFKALTIAGGFTKWGSGSRVKVLRPNNNKQGYETIKVNIKDVIDGDATADLNLKSGDTIIVSAAIL